MTGIYIFITYQLDIHKFAANSTLSSLILSLTQLVYKTSPNWRQSSARVHDTRLPATSRPCLKPLR